MIDRQLTDMQMDSSSISY